MPFIDFTVAKENSAVSKLSEKSAYDESEA